MRQQENPAKRILTYSKYIKKTEEKKNLLPSSYEPSIVAMLTDKHKMKVQKTNPQVIRLSNIT